MKVLVIDDSYRKSNKYLGNGGFCIDINHYRSITDDLISIKTEFGIPEDIEIKWSPRRNTFLWNFPRRRELYERIIDLIEKYNCTILCSVCDLKQCYGYALHDWSIDKSKLWATQLQLRYIIERFETPYLKQNEEQGIVICDNYSSHEGDKELLKQVYEDIKSGTNYRDFHNVCLTVTTISEYCFPLQIADVVTGIIVSSLDGSSFGLQHFERVAKCFLMNPHEGATSFASILSGSVLGFGLKLFPDSFNVQGNKLFEGLDRKFIHTNDGLVTRNPSITANP